MEIGEEVVLPGPKKGTVLEKEYKIEGGIRFCLIEIEAEDGELVKLKIREER